MRARQVSNCVAPGFRSCRIGAVLSLLVFLLPSTGSAVATVNERLAEYDSSVEFKVVERHPDLPAIGARPRQPGSPKVIVFKKDKKEIARAERSADGLSEQVTGTIPDGPVRAFYTPLQKARELFYKNNVRHGPEKSFDRNGKIIGETEWVEGKPDGWRRLYQEDTRRLFREEQWQNGSLRLVKTYWFQSTKNLRTEQAFTDDKPGPVKYFDLDGKPTTKSKWTKLDDPELALESGPIVNPQAKSNGEPCTRGDDCRSGHCSGRYCRAKPGYRQDLGSNQSCQADSWCASFVCRNNRCQ